MDLLVIGDCSVDLYMDILDSSVLQDPSTQESKLCFLHGSKIPVEKFNTNLAGNAIHVGVGAAKLGLKTQVYTELGDDDYGHRFFSRFEKENVNTEYVRLNKGENTNVHAIIWHAGDRTIFSYHEPRKYELDFSKLEKPKWLYYTSLAHGFERFQEGLVVWLKENSDIGVTFNPGSIQMTEIAEVHKFLKVTDVLFVNREEGEKIAGFMTLDETPILKTHERLHELGAKMIVMTDGKKGSSVYNGNNLYEKPATIVDKVLDKTGAGDTFAATFLAALHYGKDIETAMDWGNRNSANTVQVIGCIDGLMTLDEIEKKQR